MEGMSTHNTQSMYAMQTEIRFSWKHNINILKEINDKEFWNHPSPPQIKDSLHVRESPIPLQADFSPEAFGSAELDVECQPLKGGHCPPTKNTSWRNWPWTQKWEMEETFLKWIKEGELLTRSAFYQAVEAVGC